MSAVSAAAERPQRTEAAGVRLAGVSRHFGDVRALDGLDL
jgi:hypothetical protein